MSSMEVSISATLKGLRASLAVGKIDLVHGGDVTATSGELHMPMNLHSPKQQGVVALKAQVASVYVSIILDVSKACFKCFVWMLEK